MVDGDHVDGVSGCIGHYSEAPDEYKKKLKHIGNHYVVFKKGKFSDES